jgi:hypothetical protein
LRLEQTRDEIVEQLLKKDRPWIEDFNDLKSVIVDLTRSNKPTSLYQMERLFHSCRREPAVTREAVDLIKVNLPSMIELFTI